MTLARTEAKKPFYGYLARGERFGFLIDARGGSGLSPEQRHRVVAHLGKQAHLMARFLCQAPSWTI